MTLYSLINPVFTVLNRETLKTDEVKLAEIAFVH